MSVWIVGALLCVASGCRGQRRGAEGLRAQVDSLLPQLEQLSGLAAHNEIRLATRTKNEVRSYVESQLDKDLPPEELNGIHGTYAALGLIPDTLDLRRLLLELYAEQVAGYYDPRTKTFYVIEGTPPGALKTVLAHELVHALQDQHVDLDSLISNKRNNDRQSAAQAAVEGQATVVMFAVMMQQASGVDIDVTAMPDLGEQLRPALEQQNSQFPVFRSAPLIIRETLLFPYLQGAGFVQALWRTHARSSGSSRTYPAPLDSLLPQSTEQVMHPDSFVVKRDVPTEITLEALPAGWKLLYENTLGALETSIFLRQHLGAGAAAMLGWDGDRYRLIEKQGVGRALLWVTVWDDAASADRFADAYRRILAMRNGRKGIVERMKVHGREVVRVVDTTIDDATTVPRPNITSLAE